MAALEGSVDYTAKRRSVGIMVLNCRLEDATLIPTMAKPFDVLAEGLISEESRGNRTAIELFQTGVRALETGMRRFFVNLPDENVGKNS